MAFRYDWCQTEVYSTPGPIDGVRYRCRPIYDVNNVCRKFRTTNPPTDGGNVITTVWVSTQTASVTASRNGAASFDDSPTRTARPWVEIGMFETPTVDGTIVCYLYGAKFDLNGYESLFQIPLRDYNEHQFTIQRAAPRSSTFQLIVDSTVRATYAASLSNGQEDIYAFNAGLEVHAGDLIGCSRRKSYFDMRYIEIKASESSIGGADELWPAYNRGSWIRWGYIGNRSPVRYAGTRGPATAFSPRWCGQELYDVAGPGPHGIRVGINECP